MRTSANAITTNQNLYGTSIGMTTIPNCISTINSTINTAVILISDLVFELIFLFELVEEIYGFKFHRKHRLSKLLINS